MFYITNKGVSSIFMLRPDGKYRMISFGKYMLNMKLNQNLQEEDWLVFQATKVGTLEELLDMIKDKWAESEKPADIEAFIQELLGKLI